jgi:hypothetical protein
MTTTLSAVLEQQATAVVGRERERAALLELTGDGGPVVAWVHGIGGAGKTALLRAFAAEAREAGAAVVALDCRTVEPTEAGVLGALSEQLDAPVHSVPEAAEALRALGDPVVLILDGYEVLTLADAWVRLTLLPALPATARIAIGSRDRPSTAWSGALGPLLRGVALGTLAPPAAEALLRRSGVPAREARAINCFAHGHPLALLLAASAHAERPGLALEHAALPTVVDALARLYLDGLDPDTRRALDAASVTRRTTLSLLAAQLPDEPAHEAFARLRALPFTELGRDGLVIQDTVREAVAALLRAGDPAAHRRLKLAAWHQLRSEMRDAHPDEMWRYTADALYLIENPGVREIYFPTAAPTHVHEPARPDDWAGIEAILRRHEPPENAAVVRRYWETAPETFVVSRGAAGELTGYYFCFVPRDVSPRVLDADPVASAWREHLRANPLPPGQIALFIREWGWQRGGRVAAPGEPSICLDIKRTYLELRPALGRAYLPVRDFGETADKLAPLGFVRAPGFDTQTGAETVYTLFADLGPASFDGWLADIGARELHLTAERVLDAEQRRLVLDGETIDLTRLELGVLRHLHEREGRVVTREELFREVWGHTWTGGDGNALEAVVSSLRRKLGSRASVLATVRGAGYRLGALR